MKYKFNREILRHPSQLFELITVLGIVTLMIATPVYALIAVTKYLVA